MISQTMIFYEPNYGEAADTVTGINLSTEYVSYLYDNRSDSGNATWSATSGSVRYTFNSTTMFSVSDIFINNTNARSGFITIYTGTSASTLTAFSLTANSFHFAFATQNVLWVDVTFTDTQDAATAYMGEFIATRKKFQLTYNPSKYIPAMVPVGVQKETWDGRAIFNRRGDRFEATIGWSLLMGSPNTLTNTDLQNVTELFRTNSSFLFWPNAGNNFVNMNTWRPQDIYKCKVTDSVSYEFPGGGMDWAIMANYKILEAK